MNYFYSLSYSFLNFYPGLITSNTKVFLIFKVIHHTYAGFSIVMFKPFNPIHYQLLYHLLWLISAPTNQDLWQWFHMAMSSCLHFYSRMSLPRLHSPRGIPIFSPLCAVVWVVLNCVSGSVSYSNCSLPSTFITPSCCVYSTDISGSPICFFSFLYLAFILWLICRFMQNIFTHSILLRILYNVF